MGQRRLPESCYADGDRSSLAFVAIDDVDDLAQNCDRLGTERPRDMDELDDAQAPLAAFVLGDERLVVAEPLGDLLLGEAMTHAQLAEQLPELLLLRRAQGIAHEEGPGSTAAAPAHNPIFGLSHFGINTDHPSRTKRASRWLFGGSEVSQ